MTSVVCTRMRRVIGICVRCVVLCCLPSVASTSPLSPSRSLSVAVLHCSASLCVLRLRGESCGLWYPQPAPLPLRSLFHLLLIRVRRIPSLARRLVGDSFHSHLSALLRPLSLRSFPQLSCSPSFSPPRSLTPHRISLAFFALNLSRHSTALFSAVACAFALPSERPQQCSSSCVLR